MNTDPAASRLRSLLLVLAALPTLGFAATPTTVGDSGLIAMPDARVAPDGTVQASYTYGSPYGALNGSMTVFDGVEFSLTYLKIDGVHGFVSGDYGAYKDKQFQLKWSFLDEGEWLPALALGWRDFHGTSLMEARYLVATKRVGDLDLTLGYGDLRLDGAFGGLRYAPDWAGGFGLVAEHDANQYALDPFAADSDADLREGTTNLGVEYRGMNWGVQLSRDGGELGGKLWLSVPLGEPDLVPKEREPKPLTESRSAPQPRVAWTPRAEPTVTLARALYDQDFDQVQVALVGARLELALTNHRISLIGRAVGRAARTALLYGPSDMTTLRITYTRNDLAVASYEFRDLAVLRDYFAGKAGAAALTPTITVLYARAEDLAPFRGEDLVYSLDRLPLAQEAETRLAAGPDAVDTLLFVERSDRDGATFGVKPLVLAGFFNDAGGAFRYDLFAAGYYSQRYAPGLYGNAAVRLTLSENMSELSGLNTSTLPHVRSDVALYKKDAGALKLESLFLSKYAQLGERLYARASAGYYEEMFLGAGGQVLWLPANGPWAFDVDVEYARQRDYDGGFGLLDYDTVTGIASAHYRFPAQGITATLRGGMFLARDEGYRFELRRRLRSGVQFGFWYTVTNGDDITGPGSPGDPYYDKGLFVSVPLRLSLPYDTQSTAGFALSPWSRDVGQMVRSPGDLYLLFEQTLLLNASDQNPLSQFGR